MTEQTKSSLKIAAGIFLLLLLPKNTQMAAIKTNLSKFLSKWEGFSPTPYWDVNRWSWGYGTRVPNSGTDKTKNPGGTITRDKAMSELQAYASNDLMELLPLVVPRLNARQWAAFLSFSYNLGLGNANNLLANINAQDNAALETQWKKYIYADGVVNQNLVARRNAEWQLWLS